MIKADVLVIIPHYNNPDGLKDSLNSISETINVDVLIVDDGSRNLKFDKSSLSEGLPSCLRLIYSYLQENMGIEHALNEGLRIARESNYNFIARLDCGDLCTANRFKHQIQFLRNNPSIGMIGSFVNFIDLEGRFIFNLTLPTEDLEIRRKMYLNAMFIHPTIMFRKEVLQKVQGYPTQYKAAEDYAFFFEIIKHFRVANIDKELVSCELNPKGISVSRRKKQVANRIRIILSNFYFGFYPIYGLIRNVTLYLVPNSIILFLKKKFK